MPTDVTDLSTLSAAAVNEREQLLIEYLTELYPDLDFSKGGVLEQLLARPNAVLDVLNRTEIARLKASMSFVSILKDPTVVDADTVDNLLGNYNITPRPATYTSGVMAVVMNEKGMVIINTTLVFTLGSRTFKTDQDYIVVTSPGLVNSSTKRLLQQRSDGKYWFTVNVVETVPAGLSISRGTPFTLTTPIAIEAYAASDFPAGQAEETADEMVGRLMEGIAAKATSDRVSISSMLHTEYPTMTDISIIGYGDTEMLRDRRNIFGIGHGGKADIYVRTTAYPLVTRLTMAVKPVAYYDSQGIYRNVYPVVNGKPVAGNITVVSQASIPPTWVPGFYRVEKITALDPTMADTRTIPSIEPSARDIYTPVDADFVPAFNNAEEAYYSPYQGNTTLRISDPEDQVNHSARVMSRLAGYTAYTLYVDGEARTMDVTGANSIEELLTVEGYRLYDIYVSAMPLLSTVQGFFSRDRRAPVGDYLVKAVYPCFVAADVTFAYKAGTTPPDTASVQNAIALAINTVAINNDLTTNTVSAAVSALLGANGYLSAPIHWTGTIPVPGTDAHTFTGIDNLVIPSLTGTSITKRTTVFCALAANINVVFNVVAIST